MALYCSQCGVENHPEAVTCYHCQSPLARPVYGPEYSQAPHEYAENADPQGQSNRQSSGLSRMGSLFVGAVCVLYLLNPTAGFLELLPDNLPVVGNLDEAAAVTGLLMALSNLGVIPYRRS